MGSSTHTSPSDAVHGRRERLRRARSYDRLVWDPTACGRPVSSVPPSETQVTNTGSFVVCCGIANESAEALTTPFTGSRCLGFEFEITGTATVRDQDPWFQAYLDGGVATRPFTLNGRPGLSMSSHPPNGSRSIRNRLSSPSVAVKRRPSASTVRRRAETNSNPLRDGYGLSRDSGRGATSNVGSLPARYLIAGHTERQQNGSSWRVISSSPIAPRDGSRSHGSGGQCSRRWSRWLSSLSESEASPYDRLRYEPDYPSRYNDTRHGTPSRRVN